MKRKVVQHGPATLIMSLPKAWVSKYGIAKGDELHVMDQDNTLLVSTEMHVRSMEIDVDISGLDRTSIMYVIRGYYRLGYDVLRLRFSESTVKYGRKNEDLSVISIIHTEVNRLVGYEIIDEKRNSCTIKDLQETSGKDFDQVLRRVFLLIQEAYTILEEGAKSGKGLEDIEHLHDTITKFASYCLRMLNKKSKFNPQHTAYYYHIIAYLDRITDIIKYAARLLRRSGKAHSAVQGIIKSVGQDIQTYYKLFYTYNNRTINEINERRYAVEDVLEKLPENLPNAQVRVATSLFHILEMLLDLIEARTALEH